MKKKYQISDVILELISKYQYAEKTEWICKPLSYAVYHTWKWIDEREKER